MTYKIGTNLEITTPYNPEQNLVSKRVVRTIIKQTRSIIIKIGIPDFLWPKILRAIIVVTN